MSDFARGSEQPPEIVVMDEAGFNESFPLAVSVDRKACGAFLVACDVDPVDVPAVSVMVKPEVCIRGQMIDDYTGVGQLQFVDHDTEERNVTLHAGSVMQRIIEASEARFELPLSTMQMAINRQFGVSLSCCADELTIGYDGVQKEIEDAKRIMRRNMLSVRLPLGFGGTLTTWGLTEAITGSPLAASVAASMLAGVAFYEGRDHLRKAYQTTDITGGWPYQERAKQRVIDLVENPEQPLVTFNWKPNL